MSRYSELNEKYSLEKNQVIAIYLNCIFSSVLVLTMIIIAATISPLANDANILINDASQSLNDFSIMIPEVNGLIPEAKNTTRILGHMIPEITRGLSILKQICRQDPGCHY